MLLELRVALTTQDEALVEPYLDTDAEMGFARTSPRSRICRKSRAACASPRPAGSNPENSNVRRLGADLPLTTWEFVTSGRSVLALYLLKAAKVR
jgi:hypothetical protein